MTAPTASIATAASISRSPLKRASSPAAHASMAVATGCGWALGLDCLRLDLRASRVPSAPISIGQKPAANLTEWDLYNAVTRRLPETRSAVLLPLNSSRPGHAIPAHSRGDIFGPYPRGDLY